MQEPYWIGKGAAMAMHERQLAEHGGISGTRDEGLLESALDKPKNLFFYSDAPVDMARLAASYAYGIATNHPFLDGNKRTAHVVARTFLLLNGYNLEASQEEKYKTIMALAASEMDEDALAAWFAKNTKKS
ncbi:MAG TPA: type II toxin-antitoxin system death-on-curing family toxin [Rhodospirillaceae bacterium]|nr:type II toxin-antitoxin system death-on-curing family toxin [Rhodospirillaceae bacterium]